jgi:hypothetical protein
MLHLFLAILMDIIQAAPAGDATAVVTARDILSVDVASE